MREKGKATDKEQPQDPISTPPQKAANEFVHCGPACSCGGNAKTGGNSIKIKIMLLVLAAVAVAIIYRGGL